MVRYPSHKYILDIPYTDLTHEELQKEITNGNFLEMLFNLTNDPDEVVNLMDMKHPNIVNQNNNVAEKIYNNLINTLTEKNIVRTKATLFIPIGTIRKLIYFLNKYIDDINDISVELMDFLEEGITNILISYNGTNNFDSPGLEFEYLRKINAL